MNLSEDNFDLTSTLCLNKENSNLSFSILDKKLASLDVNSNKNQKFPQASDDVLKKRVMIIKKYHNKDECCAICLNYLVSPKKTQNLSRRVKRLSCNHQFHIACINKWLDKFNTCPLCRHKIDSSSSHFFG